MNSLMNGKFREVFRLLECLTSCDSLSQLPLQCHFSQLIHAVPWLVECPLSPLPCCLAEVSWTRGGVLLGPARTQDVDWKEVSLLVISSFH